ncbi:MAG: hypothetical protein AAF529_19770, partial [Pseudomonadota bacterium]
SLQAVVCVAPALAIDGWRENLRSSLDVSSRPLYYFDADRAASMNFVGVDIHKVFSTQHRDVGVLTAQAYLTRIDDVRGYPGFFDDDHDSEVVYRIFNFNFTGLGEQLPNLRVGHMEVAYGLEHTIDTNGTLQQYGQPQNLGVKADWGMSLNKEHQRFEYELSVTSGGGQELKRQDGSFVLAGRVGTPRDGNLVLGASVYRSLLRGVVRERAGVDLQYFFGRNNLNAELSSGQNNSDDVLNALLEFNRFNQRESLRFYTQLLYLSNTDGQQWQRTTNASIGVSYLPDTRLDLSAQYGRTLQNPAGTHPSTLSLQVRYRF